MAPPKKPLINTTTMKKKNIFSAILMMCLMLVSSVVLTACSEEDVNTDQYQQGVHLNVYGPSPVMRGGELRFLGSNLDQVAQVIIPGVDPITNIQVVKAGVPSEIRVTVPHDGPEPGVVTLVTRTDEKITTLTPLTYSEPIVIESVTASAMPGDVIEIKGDYLNLIHAVGFAENEVVGEKAFVEHDRYTIKVIVPETARTGKLSLYDVDITAMDDASSDVTYNIIMTDEAVVIGTPTVAKLASPRGEGAAITAKVGETITITGANFQLVKAINFGDVESELGLGVYGGFTNFTVSKDGKTITFALPAEATDGSINLVAKSDVEIPAGKLTTVAPTGLAAAPAPVKANNSLTITGNDLDVIAQIQFPNCDVQDVTVAEGKIVVQVPETAQEGDIQLIMVNGKRTPVAYTLVKPVVTSFNLNPAAAGSEVELQGTDLDLVKSVVFTGGVKVSEFTAAADGSTLTVKIPLDAESGAITLNLANGTSVETPALEISKPVFCYIMELPGEDAELRAGEVFSVKVSNGDKLTGVQVDGKDVQYILNGDVLYISAPITAGKKSIVKLVSSNGEVEYNIAFIPNTEVNTVLWTGQAVVDDWSNQPYVLSDGGAEFAEAGLVAGDVITFHMVPTAADWKIQFVEGHWGPTYASICNIGGDTEGGKFTEYDLEANKGNYSLTLTQEMIDAAMTQQWWGGIFVLNGDNLIVDKITATHFNSVETTLWEGEMIADDWGNQPYALSDAGAEFAENDVKAGQTIRFYITALDADWKLEILEGHWGPHYAGFCNFGADTEGGKFTEWDLGANGGAVSFTLTQEMIDAAMVQQWWGGIFVLNGDNVKCTKITVE